MWKPGCLELTHPYTNAKRTVATLVLPLLNSTPEQHSVIVGVLKDKYGFAARKITSAALNDQMVIRVDDRTDAREATKLSILLHMTDPGNWRKSLLQAYPEGPGEQTFTYQMTSLQDGQLAAGMLEKLGVKYRAEVATTPNTPHRLRISGKSPVEQLLRQLPALAARSNAILSEEPSGDNGGSGAPRSRTSFHHGPERGEASEPQKTAKREPSSQPYPRYADGPHEAPQPGHIHVDDSTSKKPEPSRTYRQRPYGRVRPDATSGERDAGGPGASKVVDDKGRDNGDAALKAKLSYDSLMEWEKRRAIYERGMTGSEMPEFSADARLDSIDKAYLHRLVRAPVDGSQDLRLERERETARWDGRMADKQRETGRERKPASSNSDEQQPERDRGGRKSIWDDDIRRAGQEREREGPELEMRRRGPGMGMGRGR